MSSAPFRFTEHAQIVWASPFPTNMDEKAGDVRLGKSFVSTLRYRCRKWTSIFTFQVVTYYISLALPTLRYERKNLRTGSRLTRQAQSLWLSEDRWESKSCNGANCFTRMKWYMLMLFDLHFKLSLQAFQRY